MQEGVADPARARRAAGGAWASATSSRATTSSTSATTSSARASSRACSRRRPASARRRRTGRRRTFAQPPGYERRDHARRARRTSRASRRSSVYPVERPDADRARRVGRPRADGQRRRRRARRRGRRRSARRRGRRALLGVVPDAGRAARRDAPRRDVLVVTDKNRLAGAGSWTHGDATTSASPSKPARPTSRSTTDLGDARLDVFPGAAGRRAHDDATTSACKQRARDRRTATRSRTRPRTAPPRALDGDPDDRVARAGVRRRASASASDVDLDAPITTDHVNLVQPLNGGRNRWITKVELTFDGGDPVNVDARPTLAHGGRARRSRSRAARSSTFDDQDRADERPPARTCSARPTPSGSPRSACATSTRRTTCALHEVDADADRPARARSARRPANHPLVLVMRRDAVRPVPPRTQPELSIARAVRAARRRARSCSTGNATRRVPTRPTPRSTRALGDAARAVTRRCRRASSWPAACVPRRAAIDGDPDTAWQTPFVGVRGQWVEYTRAAPSTFDHLDLRVIADGRHSVPTTAAARRRRPDRDAHRAADRRPARAERDDDGARRRSSGDAVGRSA